MKNGLALVAIAMAWSSAATAHPGAHVHPHDGAHWLIVVSALALIVFAGGLALARSRFRR